jgi:hypothetical protein
VPSGEANKTAVFSGVTLDDIYSGKYGLIGKLGGGNVNDRGGLAWAYSYTLSSGTLTVIFQRVDDGYCKCVEVKLTEDGGTIMLMQIALAIFKAGSRACLPVKLIGGELL